MSEMTENNETLPTEEFNLSLPPIDDDGKIKPFVAPVDADQALIDVSQGKIPAIVFGVTIDF
jgi:hypothetical protein